jgi:hypothetical protein
MYSQSCSNAQRDPAMYAVPSLLARTTQNVDARQIICQAIDDLARAVQRVVVHDEEAES